MVNLQAQNKAPSALAVEVLSGLAAWAVINGASSGFLGFLANLPQTALFGSMAIGIHSTCKPSKGDYLEAIDLAGDCLTLGYRKSGLQAMIAPTATALVKLTGIDDHDSSLKASWNDLFTQSAIIVAPTGGGKSIFTSMLHVEREKAFPGAPFRVGSCNPWKRYQTWMGLSKTPQWLQDHYLAFGLKYRAESDIKTAAFRDIDDSLDALYTTYLRRIETAAETRGNHGPFEIETLTIDEFPAYHDWLKRTGKNGQARLQKIKELLCEGNGYKCILWVITQADAVGMFGLSEAEQAQLMLVRIFKPGEFKSSKGNKLSQEVEEFVNRYTMRRCLLAFNGQYKIFPIPECEMITHPETGDRIPREPCIDWSNLVEQGEIYSWLDQARPAIVNAYKMGHSKSKIWQTLTGLQDFPSSGNKRQGDDNPHYRYFKQVYGGL